MDHDDLIRSKSGHAPPQVRTTINKKAKAILDRRIEGIKRHRQNMFYLVQWEGQPLEEATWEQDIHLWQFEDKIAKFREHLREQADYFKDKTRNIAIWTLQLIAGYLFDSIVFPITFFILLFVVTKGALLYLFEERRYQSFKEDISEIAKKFYERDQQRPDKRTGRIRLTRRLSGYDRSRTRKQG